MNSAMEAEYRSKFITLEEAMTKIKSNQVIVTGHYGNEPRAMMGLLHTLRDDIENVTIWVANPTMNYPLFSMADKMRDKIKLFTSFYGPRLRECHSTGIINKVPNNLHRIANTIIDRGKPNIFWAAVSPPDEAGYVSLSLSQQCEYEILNAADMLIFEINPNIPRTFGTSPIHISRVAYFIDTDYPICEAPTMPITDTERAIAANVASLINDGDTIQFGIGGLPNAIADELMCKHDLGVYTEMIGNAMSKLMQNGVVTNRKKNFHPDLSITSFAWGNRDLYDFLDNNPTIRFLPASYINAPENIARNNNLVSVNTAIEMDICGQVCSESVGFRTISGTGGAMEFAYGALHSKGGRGIIAISSSTQGGKVSRIKTALTPGATVSIPRNLVDYVITEYGIARLRDCSIRERVNQLISIAHPDFRAELRKDADRYMLW